MADKYYRGQRSVNGASSGTTTAPFVDVLTVIEDYQKKVREIALLQCRCDTGADIESDLPRADDQETPQAA